MSNLPQTLGELRRSSQFPEQRVRNRRVKDEMRDNLIAQAAQPASRSSPASSATTTRSCRRSSTRSCRGTTSSCSACAARPRAASCARLTTLLDEQMPVICAAARSTTIRSRRSAAAAARAIARDGDDAPIAWLPRDERYVEKLATPDVTIADMIGDIDPDQGGAGRAQLGRRVDDALRPAAARQSRHLRHQRAARSGRQDPGRPVQHPAGRRRPDQGLSRSGCRST